MMYRQMNQHRHTGQITTILVLYQRATNVRSLTHTLPGLLSYKTGVCVFLATTISWQCFLQYRMPSACAYVFNLKRNYFFFTGKKTPQKQCTCFVELYVAQAVQNFYKCTRVQIGICFSTVQIQENSTWGKYFQKST